MIRQATITTAALGMFLAISCKREQRSFHVSPAAAETVAYVPGHAPVRPGPEGEPLPVATTTRPSQLPELSNEPYGRSYPNNAQAESDGNSLTSFTTAPVAIRTAVVG